MARFEHPMRLHLSQGRVDVDVGEEGAGFTVVTPVGEVVDLGQEVEGFNLGDRVFGLTGLQFGTYAEYFVVKVPGVVLKMPDDLPYDEASVFCDGHTTSYNFLTQHQILNFLSKV